MEVVIAKTAGFCFGVKNAVLETEKKLKEHSVIYCLGELVHNSRVISELNNKGLKIIEKIEEAPENSIVVIRAHGEPKVTYKKAQEKNIEIIDLTCPKVSNIHKTIEEYTSKKYFTIIIGERTHPETIGHIGYAENVGVASNQEELIEVINCIEKNCISDILIIAQTTFSISKFNDFIIVLQNVLVDKNIVIKNTICSATKERQEEAEKLSKQVDVVIIVGGKNSSNTKKLYDISIKNNNNCRLVENVAELDIQDIKQFNKIGILAGASTPNNSIQEIVNILRGE